MKPGFAFLATFPKSKVELRSWLTGSIHGRQVAPNTTVWADVLRVWEIMSHRDLTFNRKLEP